MASRSESTGSFFKLRHQPFMSSVTTTSQELIKSVKSIVSFCGTARPFGCRIINAGNSPLQALRLFAIFSTPNLQNFFPYPI